MKDTEYVYAVGRIRAKELSLLTSADVKRLIVAKSYGEAVSMLESKGYAFNSEDYTEGLNRRKAELWRFMTEILPDISMMNSLIIKNDYFNLKAAVKTAVTGISAADYLAAPSVYPPEAVYRAVTERKFGDLPEELVKPCERAYDILSRTKSAQLSDAVIDKAAMKAMLRIAKEADSDIFSDIAETAVAAADIKTAYRCIAAEKSADFMKYALCSCKAFSSDDLIKNALSGTDEFLAWLDRTDYAGASEALRVSSTAFEKYCDDRITDIIQRGKMTAFGIDPIAAYYIAAENEILTLRIILSGKINDVSEEIIGARVRKTYV